jgi:hypothetical protein
MKKKLQPPVNDDAQKDNDLMHVKASYDPKKKLAIASTAAVDRHGEVIDQDGWELEGYKNNPVLLWAHDNYEPAVGSGRNPVVTFVGGQKALVFEPFFHGKTELSRALDVLYNGDSDTPPTLNSFSVGFRPTEQDGNVFTKSELLEISCVNVPANADARMRAYKTLVGKGFSDVVAKDVLQFKGAVEDELNLEAQWQAKWENIESVRDIYCAFIDVYLNEDTSVEDFSKLVSEVADLFSQVADGTFVDPSEDDTMTEAAKVLDKLRSNNKNNKDSGHSAKGKAKPAPTTKVLSQRQMLAKAIVRAADSLGSSKNQPLLTKDHQTLVKIIKRSADKLTASQKEEIRNG